MMKKKNRFLPWKYGTPALVLIGVIVVFPILYTGYIALTNMNMYHWDDYHIYWTGELPKSFDKSRFRVPFCVGNHNHLDGFKYGDINCGGIFFSTWVKCERIETGKSI